MRIINLLGSRTVIRYLVVSGFLLLSLPVQTHAQKQSSSFTARLVNIESTTKDPFRFDANLHNAGSESKMFNLSAKLPIGWIATFRTGGSQIAAIKVDSAKTENVSIEITTPTKTDPKTYDIPVYAVSGGDTLQLMLQAVVKGSYGLELTTPTGRLSDDVTEGSSKAITLTVKNTGSMPLKGINLTSQSPSQWSVSFDLSKIENLDPGESKDITATVDVPDKTIAGDYVTTFTAKNDFSSSDAQFRITVDTSLLSGWLGIVIILIALGLVYYLIRKYGRR